MTIEPYLNGLGNIILILVVVWIMAQVFGAPTTIPLH